MKQPPLRLWGLLLCFALLLSAWGQPSSGLISKIEIKHVGPASVSDELIRANIRVKVGDNYFRAATDDDVRNLYSTGQFYNIRVVPDITPNGVVLTYVLQGKPRLTEIHFYGNQHFTYS